MHHGNALNLRFLSLALASVLIIGCSRDNGLPGDIVSHLADRGIAFHPKRVHAPAAGRYGYIAARYDIVKAEVIISAFRLEKISADTPDWSRAASFVGQGSGVDRIWGATGRPPQFKLANGGQLEYFFLILTTDGWIYIASEYAYG